MIKLLTIDLDGTLLDNKKNISEYNLEMIKKAQNLGTNVVIASGRPLNGVLPILDKIKSDKTDNYVICFNGALIKNITKNEIIYQNTITGYDVKRVYKESLRVGLNCHAFRYDMSLITPKENPYTTLESTLNKVPFEIFDFNEIKNDELFLKAMIVDEEKKIDDLFLNVSEDLRNDYQVLRSAKIFLEFLPLNTDKGFALNILANKLGISQNQTMAIGDANNDKNMLKVAHIKVAMENSFKEILDIADYITKSNEESGVGHAINHFIVKNNNKI